MKHYLEVSDITSVTPKYITVSVPNNITDVVYSREFIEQALLKMGTDESVS